MIGFYTLLALGLAILYALIAALLHRAAVPQAHLPAHLPRVAVLVAMRNEEAHIADCLTALTRQTYPSERYDVFVLDDQSQDRSAAIAARFDEKFAQVHLRTIGQKVPGLSGKMNVLAQGLRDISHDIVLITDADCVVGESWIETMVAHFDRHTGMVGGLTVLYPFGNLRIRQPLRSVWARVQALDWIFLQQMAAANSRFGKPITILGNNFGFRREAYQQVGGFEALGFSLTEDFALMEAIRKQTSWKIRHTIDPGNAIYSRPVRNLNAFFKQRLRWIKGGKSARPWGLFVIGFAVLTHVTVLATLLAAWQNPLTWLALCLLLLTNALVVAPVLRKLNLQKLWTVFPLFEVFYFSYLVVFALLAVLPLKVEWKGRKFKV